MADIAGWIALIATSIAALMTAANLGARVTGWGFAVFTVGAVVGLTSHQTQLLWSNIFLGLVDIFGIWRWLGIRARVSDTVKVEEQRSARRDGEDLFSVGKLDDLPVIGADGSGLAHVADARASCNGGGVAYLIIREGGVAGVGDTLRRLPWHDAKVCGDKVTTQLDAAAVGWLSVATG